jgi:heat shock protein HslJ
MKNLPHIDQKPNRRISRSVRALLLVLLTVPLTFQVTQAGESTSNQNSIDPLPVLETVWVFCPQHICDENQSTQVYITATFTSIGYLSGYSGCNRFESSYMVEGSTMHIGAISTTRIGCEVEIMEQEQAFLTALSNTATYRIHVSRLELYAVDSSMLAIFEVKNETLMIFIPYISTHTPKLRAKDKGLQSYP